MTTSLRNIDIMKGNTRQHSLYSGSGTLSCCSVTDTTVQFILKFSRTRNPLWKKDSQSQLNSPSAIFTRYKAFYVSCTDTQTTQVNCNYAGQNSWKELQFGSIWFMRFMLVPYFNFCRNFKQTLWWIWYAIVGMVIMSKFVPDLLLFHYTLVSCYL
jgi:hypothetical protein